MVKNYKYLGGAKAGHGVSTSGPGVSTSDTQNPSGQNIPGPQRKNLSSIIRGFKSSVTKNSIPIISVNIRTIRVICVPTLLGWLSYGSKFKTLFPYLKP